MRKIDLPGQENAGNEPSAEDRIRKWQWGVFGLILILGLLLRVGYIRVLQQEPEFDAPRSDMFVHDYWARALVTGQWIKPKTDENPHLDQIPFLRPPGYPYFLALIYKIFGMNYLMPRIVQALIGLVSCVLAFFWGRKLIDTPTALLWSAFMAGFWLLIYFEGELNAPVVIILLFLLMFGSLWRWCRSMHPVWLILGGLWLGIVTLFSPNLLGIIPVIFLWCLWVIKRRGLLKRRWIWAVVFLAVTAGAIAPATIRNYRVCGEWILISCNGAISFYTGNSEISNGYSSRIPHLVELTGIEDWGWFQYPLIVKGLSRQHGRDLTYSEVSKYYNQKAWDYIRAHPGQTLARMLNKAAFFWGPLEVPSNKEIQNEKYKTPIFKYSPGFAMFLAPGIIGFFLMIYQHIRRRGRTRFNQPPGFDVRWEIAVLITLFILLYFLSYLPFTVSSRYRAPVAPFVLLAAAYSWRCLLRYGANRRWQSMLLWGIMVLCALSLVARPAPGYSVSAVPAHILRGETYLNQGQTESALKEFQAAVAQAPKSDRAWKGMAFALSNMKRFPDAVQAANKALEFGGRSADLYYVLGVALIQARHPAEGVKALEESLRINPNYANAYGAIGVFYAMQNDLSRAIQMFEKAVQLKPDDPMLLKFLAKALFATNQFDSAVNHLNTSIAIQPNDPEAHFLLASIHLQRNHHELARSELQRCLEIDPKFSKASDLLNQLNNK